MMLNAARRRLLSVLHTGVRIWWENYYSLPCNLASGEGVHWCYEGVCDNYCLWRFGHVSHIVITLVTDHSWQYCLVCTHHSTAQLSPGHKKNEIKTIRSRQLHWLALSDNQSVLRLVTILNVKRRSRTHGWDEEMTIVHICVSIIIVPTLGHHYARTGDVSASRVDQIKGEDLPKQWSCLTIMIVLLVTSW